MNRTHPLWIPYVVPFAVYLFLTCLEVCFPNQYMSLYALKIAIVAVLAIVMRPPATRSQTRLRTSTVLVSVILGVGLNAIWIALDRYSWHPQWLTDILVSRPSIDPFGDIANPLDRTLFLVSRVSGLVLLIPYIEENFYRDFLLRWIYNPTRYAEVPVGTITPFAVACNIVIFASTHPAWLPALLFGLTMCILVWKTKDSRACIVAHAATNLALCVYVIHGGNWHAW